MHYFLFFILFFYGQVLLDHVNANKAAVTAGTLKEIEAIILSFDRAKLLNYPWNASGLTKVLDRLCRDATHPNHSYCYLQYYQQLFTVYFSKAGVLKKSASEFFDWYHYRRYQMLHDVFDKTAFLVYFGEANKTRYETSLTKYNNILDFRNYFSGLFRCIKTCHIWKSNLEEYFHAISNRIFVLVFHKIAYFINNKDSNGLQNYLRTTEELLKGYNLSSNDKWLITRVFKYIDLNLRFKQNQEEAVKYFVNMLTDSSLKCKSTHDNPCSQDRTLFELVGFRLLFQVTNLDELKPKLKFTSIEHLNIEEKKLLLFCTYGLTRLKDQRPRYMLLFRQFDSEVFPLYINDIHNLINSPNMNKVDLVKAQLEKLDLGPLCPNSQWTLCNLNTLIAIFKGVNIDLLKSKLNGPLENTKMNQIIFDLLSKYPKHKRKMQYAKISFDYLDGHISTTYMALVREYIKSRSQDQLITLANGFFKYISLEFLPRVCVGYGWKMCHLKNFYALISSGMSIEKGWQGNIISLHDVRTTNIERKLDVLIEEKNHIETISNIQSSANQISSQIHQSHDTVVQSFGGAFSKLGYYFKSKATVEVGSFKKQVSLSRETSTQLLTEITSQIQPLVSDLTGLNKIVTTLVALRIVEKLAEIVLKTMELVEVVANNCNPFKALFGGTDFAKAAQLGIELVQLASDLARLFRQTVEMVRFATEIKKVATGLSTKLNGLKKMQDDNTRILKTIHDLNLKKDATAEELNLFVSSFLSLYQSFQVPMTSSDIASLESSTVFMIDYMCDLVADDDTTVDGGVKVAAEEFCGRLMKKSPNLFSRLHEVFGELNVQFEKLGSFARASATLHSATLLSKYANGLAANKVSTGPLYVLEYASLSKLFVEDEIQEAAFQFCKFHGYKFGVAPEVCEGGRPYSPTQIQQMRYYAPPITKVDLITPLIPTKQEMSPDKRMYPYVDLEALAKGETITFTLPSWDHEWMKKHRWALPYDSDSTMNYVESFELFLPLVKKSGVKGTPYIHVKTTAKSGNIQRLRPQDSTLFSIPKHEYAFEHSFGDSICPLLKKDFNPYHKKAECLKPGGSSSVCIVSHGSTTDNQGLYPSLFTEWSFSANYAKSKSYEMVKPETGMQMYLIANVALRRAGRSKRSTPFHQRENSCCPENKYKRLTSTGASECVKCPNGKSNALNGYTCKQ